MADNFLPQLLCQRAPDLEGLWIHLKIVFLKVFFTHKSCPAVEDKSFMTNNNVSLNGKKIAKTAKISPHVATVHGSRQTLKDSDWVPWNAEDYNHHDFGDLESFAGHFIKKEVFEASFKMPPCRPCRLGSWPRRRCFHLGQLLLTLGSLGSRGSSTFDDFNIWR